MSKRKGKIVVIVILLITILAVVFAFMYKDDRVIETNEVVSTTTRITVGTCKATTSIITYTTTTTTSTMTSTTTTTCVETETTVTSTLTSEAETQAYEEIVQDNPVCNDPVCSQFWTVNELTYYSGPSGCYGAYGRTLINDYSIACNSLPDGTIVHIESWDGTINGNYRVDDTGGMGDNVIDIFYSDYSYTPYDFAIAGRIGCDVWIIE